MKALKILMKTLGVVVLLVVATLIIVPVFFKDEIKELTLETINSEVTAEVTFDGFKLSLFKNFPDFTMSLTDVYIKGVNEFENDTLAGFRTFSLVLDLKSVFSDNVTVKSILIDQPIVNAVVLADGKANWDIVPITDTIVEAEVEETSEESTFGASLNEFAIRGANITYTDKEADMAAYLRDFNLTLAGNMFGSTTSLNLTSAIEEITVAMEGIDYLKKAKLTADVDMSVNLDNMTIQLNKNEVALNNLALLFSGDVKMPSDDIAIDIKYETRKSDFKSLLSMVPAVYMEGFEELKTNGEFKLNGFVNGVYSDADSTLPNVGVKLLVTNGYIKYPDLPKDISDINVDLNVNIDGVNMDNTIVDLKNFSLKLGDNPISMFTKVVTPISDPEVSGKLNGKIDLSTLQDVIPLDSIKLAGLINANLAFAGKQSMIDNEQYEDFVADGSVNMKGFVFEMIDMPAVIIENANMVFSPKYVEVDKLDCNIGSSDFHFVGRAENFIPYVMSDETLYGTFNFTSNNINVTELMGEEVEATESELEDTTAMEIVLIPVGFDLTLNCLLKNIEYDSLNIKNIEGLVKIKDQAATMKNLSMDMLEGNMVVTGEYNTADTLKPTFDFAMDVNDIDIQSSFYAFNTVQKLAPVAKNLQGKVSADLQLEGVLGNDMMPVYETVQGYARFQSREIAVVSSKMFDQMNKILKMNSGKDNTIKDVNINTTIKDGWINVETFPITYNGIGMEIGGRQGIDMSLDYDVRLKVPTKYIGGGTVDAMNKLLGNVNMSMGEDISVNGKIKGTSDDPKLTLKMTDSKKEATTQAKEVVVDKGKEEAKVQADKLIAEAEVKAAKLISEAEKQAAKLKEEG